MSSNFFSKFALWLKPKTLPMNKTIYQQFLEDAAEDLPSLLNIERRIILKNIDLNDKGINIESPKGSSEEHYKNLANA